MLNKTQKALVARIARECDNPIEYGTEKYQLFEIIEELIDDNRWLREQIDHIRDLVGGIAEAPKGNLETLVRGDDR